MPNRKRVPNDSNVLITLSGAGGSGKTSVCEEFVRRVPHAVIIRSVVRAYYADRGLRSEADFLKLGPEERKVFQVELLKFYIENMWKQIAAYSGQNKILICERSIFDHVGYTLYGSRELIGHKEILLLQQYIESFCLMGPHTFYLPYPAPWLKDGGGADGFRAQEYAKDTIVDAVIYRLLSSNRKIWKGSLQFVSVDERVRGIMQVVFKHDV
jgi:AAA domain